MLSIYTSVYCSIKYLAVISLGVVNEHLHQHYSVVELEQIVTVPRYAIYYKMVSNSSYSIDGFEQTTVFCDP